MNKQITEISDSDLQSALLNNSIQSEIIKSQIAMIVQEILRRQQNINQTPQQAPINLPTLKKINLPKESPGFVEQTGKI